jgi:cyclic lactone autoinducer peptide
MNILYNTVINRKEENKMKKFNYSKISLSLLTCLTMVLVTTAKATVGTTCLFFVNQPKIPNCLIENDK